MNRSPWERRIFGTYIRTACTFERRCIDQLHLAGIPPLLPVGPVPRIILDRVGAAVDVDDDAGDNGNAVGVVDLAVPGDDIVGDMDDPRLLTAG